VAIAGTPDPKGSSSIGSERGESAVRGHLRLIGLSDVGSRTYGEVAQRWVLIESQHRKANDALWRLELEKLESRLNGQVKALTQTVFACKPDALDAVMAFQDSLELHQLTHISQPSPVQASPRSSDQGG
jgi:hypothetical protein